MYKSPITIIEDQLHNQIITDYENGIMKTLMRYQIHVDKEELLKALQYDREQYEKGYQDGLNADKWIPCEEKLPPQPKICKEEGYIVQVKDVVEPFSAYWDGERWLDDYGYIEGVIAWQPLPKPYKKGE